jgi:ATP-dependent Lhr-like helicase
VLLQRHGVLTRDAVVDEGWPGGFASLYPVLRAMEESGRIRRGYFIEGLGGSQFALPGAVDRLRSMRDSGGRIIAVAATDPANAFGSVLPWSESDGRMARAAGAYCVIDSGALILYLERGGRSLLTRGEVQVEHLRALIRVATVGGKVEVQHVDGVAAAESKLSPLLREDGFSSTHRGLIAHAGA